MTSDEAVHVTVSIVVGPEGSAGTVVDPAGRRTPFAGWLGLMDAIATCTAATADKR